MVVILKLWPELGYYRNRETKRSCLWGEKAFDFRLSRDVNENERSSCTRRRTSGINRRISALDGSVMFTSDVELRSPIKHETKVYNKLFQLRLSNLLSVTSARDFHGRSRTKNASLKCSIFN